jgi:hypothetical protein
LGGHTDLPSIFNNSFAGCSSKGALIQGEGATFEEVQWIDLSLSGRVHRFPSDPVERRARRIFCLVPRQIPMEESSGAHFPDIESATLGEDTFDHQFRSREILPTHFIVDLGDHFETYINRFRRWNH